MYTKQQQQNINNKQQRQKHTQKKNPTNNQQSAGSLSSIMHLGDVKDIHKSSRPLLTDLTVHCQLSQIV